MSIPRIHHINFIVNDLEAGIKRYETILGGGVFAKDSLPDRGVITARAKIGEQWLVLVQPVDPDSAPGKFLQENGEGFFLLSFGVDGMESAVKDIEGKGVTFTSSDDRKGLLNWWVRDLEKEHTLGVHIQLCEERN